MRWQPRPPRPVVCVDCPHFSNTFYITVVGIFDASFVRPIAVEARWAFFVISFYQNITVLVFFCSKIWVFSSSMNPTGLRGVL